jgi:hypothetical protein
MKLLPWIFVPFFLAAAASPDWTRAARRLTGAGEDGRSAAIRTLKTTPGIEATLRDALQGDERFLALDAIVALKLETLYDDVLRASEQDRSGFFYLALDALVEPTGQAKLAQLYRERLATPKTSAASKVVILDSLIRMHESVHPDMLSDLLEDQSPEVRSAALYYLRGFLVSYRERELLPLLKRVLKSKLSRQRRIQALALVSELPEVDFEILRPLKISCSGDLPEALRTLCERLGTQTR